MRKATHRFIVVLTALLGLASWRGSAHDAFPPCWRGLGGSTFQHWKFNANANPAAPEVINNAYGGASAVIAVGAFGEGWQHQLAGYGTTQTGYWDLGRNGTITLTVTNRPGAPLTAYKYVRVQVTQWIDGGIYADYAAVSVPGANKLDTETQVVETVVNGGTWVVEKTTWRFEPSPADETITITGANNGSLIDQVVVDTRSMEITCPSDVLVSADPGQCSKSAVAWTLPPVDGCTVTNITCTPTNGSTFVVGTTAVACAITDGGGKTVNCAFNLTVRDTEVPAITCPADVTAKADAGACTWAKVEATLGAPVTADNCSVASVANDAPASFALGDTTVTWTVTDSSGNKATCAQKVTVVDDQVPAITCPADVTVSTDSGLCMAVVNYTAPVGTDNCDGAVAVSCVPASGFAFPKGATTVKCTATDPANNHSSCTFTVTVVDITPPVLCTGPGVTNLHGLMDDFVDPEPSSPSPDFEIFLNGRPKKGFDDGSADKFFVDSFTNLPPDITGAVLRLKLRASTGASLNDTINLLFAGPGGALRPEQWVRRIGTSSSIPGLVDSHWTPGQQSDLVLDLASLPNASGPPTSLISALRQYHHLDLWVEDCTLVDYVSLEVKTCRCRENIVAMAEPAACGATVNFAPPPFTDNCSVTVTCTPAPGSFFPLGTTPVQCQADDGSGNRSFCDFTVTVEDHVAPTITCPADVVVNTDAGQCYATGVRLGTPTVADNCPGTSVANNAPTQFPKGTNTVIWTATDASGNAATCAQHVVVEDHQQPTIGCPADVVVNTDAGQCYATGVALGAPTVDDNCPGTSVANNAPAQFPKGTTTVTWTVTDASGNVATCAQTVTVMDTAPPAMVGCPAGIGPLDMDAGQCGAVASWVAPTVMDNCPGATVSQTAGPAGGSLFPAGTTTITYTAVDAAGNTATCSFTVTVKPDAQPPVLCTGPGVTNWHGLVDDFAGPEPSSASPDFEVFMAGLPRKGFDDGTVDAYFIDSFKNLPPDITGAVLRLRLRAGAGMPENDTISLLFAGARGAPRPEQWIRTIGTFNSIPGLINSSWASGQQEEFVLDLASLPNESGPATDLIPALREYRHLDLWVEDCTLVDYVTLELTTCRCQDNIVATAAPAACGAIVNFDLPPFTDNCRSGVTVTCSPAPGSFFSLGSTLVRCQAEDGAGNQSSVCGFSVTVYPSDAPALSIRRQSRTNNVVVLSWPVTCARYVLEQADDLNSPIGWVPVPEPVAVEGGLNQVVRAATPSPRFYRLRWP